tara:strand:+ start:450 stop:683 length:234 start_codon:yes stop_codon:yes gene_type:complete
MNNEQDLEMKPLVTFAAPVVTATPAFAHIVPFLIWINLAAVQLRTPISPASRCTATARAAAAKPAIFGTSAAVDHVV